MSDEESKRAAEGKMKARKDAQVGGEERGEKEQEEETEKSQREMIKIQISLLKG